MKTYIINFLIETESNTQQKKIEKRKVCLNALNVDIQIMQIFNQL